MIHEAVNRAFDMAMDVALEQLFEESVDDVSSVAGKQAHSALAFACMHP